MNKKEEIINYLGIIVFVILQFLVISSFSNKSTNQTSGSSFQYDFKSEFHSNQAKAIIVDHIQCTSAQRSCLHILFNANLNLFSETYKLFADNNKILQRIIFLRKAELLIKPIRLVRFYFPPILMNSEDLYILS
jgi:hypothetical protein